MLRIGLRISLLLVVALGLMGCEKETLDKPITEGPTISVKWEHLGNQVEGRTNGFRSQFVLTNDGTEALSAAGWKLYFNLARQIFAGSTPDSVRITHINGDFYSLSPSQSFQPLLPGRSMEVPFSASDWMINESEAPAGLYLVFQDPEGYELLPVPIANYEIQPLIGADQLNRSPADRVLVPTPQSRFQQDKDLSLLPEDEVPLILPRPVRFSRKRGDFFLDASVPIQHIPELLSEADYLASAFQSLLGTQLVRVLENEEKAIRLSLGNVEFRGEMKSTGDQAYRLTVDPVSGVDIIGTDSTGVFYGIQSLRALISPGHYSSEKPRITIPAVAIVDFPLFTYRGQHLDVARNFQSKASVLKLLELMAFYKLNKFHFHLTDDEGWRLEIKSLPELTEIGARRGHTLDESDRLVPSFGSGPEPVRSQGTGFYRQEEFIEILRYAQKRHIEVIPEIDFPGHARAAIVSMKNRTRRLLEKGDRNGANEFSLSDPDDESVYRSTQGWRDNVVNVCQESTYAFIETVVDEIREIYRNAEVPLTSIHIGGDEVPEGVWKRSPVCRSAIDSNQLPGVQEIDDLPAYFVQRVSQILNDRDLIMSGWEETALLETDTSSLSSPNLELVNRNVRPYVWNTVWSWGGEENAYQLANSGFPVVLCNAPNLYFDLAYEKGSSEPGYYWAGFVDTMKTFQFIPFRHYISNSRDVMGALINPDEAYSALPLTTEGQQNIVGIQGQLWSENIKSPGLLDYLAFPKLLGFAERSWAPEPVWAQEIDQEKRRSLFAADWNYFANAIGQREMHRLCYLEGGVAYRIPPPGAAVENGKLEANTAYPGLVIRYTLDGSEPTENSEIYPGPINVSGTVKLRSFNVRGRASRTSKLVVE